MAGGCLCGFTSLAAGTLDLDQGTGDPQKILMQEWISTLMFSLDIQTGREESRQIMKKCARAHYDHLKMDEVLLPYIGDLKKFVQFLTSNWNWVVNFDQEKQIVIADENKDFCVCPLVNQERTVNSAVLCYCSEGFAEMMFSKISGKTAEARIISSIHRGNERCIYEIKLT